MADLLRQSVYSRLAIYETLEQRNVDYAIRMPANKTLELDDCATNRISCARRSVYNGAIRDRVRLKVLADSPGDWMKYCHILPHAGDGMMTVLRVED